MIHIDEYAYASKLKRIDSMEKLTFALVTLGVCLWADWLGVSIPVLLMMAWMAVRKGGTPFSVFISLLSIPVSFLFLAVLTIAFGISADSRQFILSVSVFGKYLGVSKTGLMLAANLFGKALGAVSCLYYLSLTTPMTHILEALRRLKCPALLVELMGLIYRFIFILTETVDQMLTAQKSRLGYLSLASGYRSFGILASTTFIRAYQRANDFFIALEARGYENELQVLTETSPKQWRNYILAIGINVFLIIITLWFRQAFA